MRILMEREWYNLYSKQECWECAYKYFVSLAMEGTSAMDRMVQIILIKVAGMCLHALNFFIQCNFFLIFGITERHVLCPAFCKI